MSSPQGRRPARATPVSVSRVRRRRDRIGAGRLRTALLSPAELAALRSVGFEPATEVLAAARASVHPHAGWCGYLGGGEPPIRLGGRLPPGEIALPFPSKIADAHDQLVAQLRDEAVAFGAHGVVGVRLLRLPAGGGVSALVATGTAVRAGSARTLDGPFVTDRAATEFAGLLRAGWAPVSLHVRAGIGVRHNDGATISQLAAAANAELVGHTELLDRTRRAAREELRAAAATAGGDGVLLSALDVETHERVCERASDRVVTALATGTSIVRVSRARPASFTAATVLPLRPVPRRGGSSP